MSPSQSTCGSACSAAQSRVNGSRTAPSIVSVHSAAGVWGTSSTERTGHLTVGDCPGGSRSGSIPSDCARRRPRSPNMRGVMGTVSFCPSPVRPPAQPRTEADREMASMRAMVVREAGGDFVLEEREVPTPGAGEALVKVHACGVCHSDSFAKEGGYPGVSHPLIPGHEIAGEIAALGEQVAGWEVGQRVGVGWFGGNCGWCEPCRRGQLIDCANMGIPGITMDGGYAEYVVVRASALAAMPDDLSPEEAGPLLCAGITTFNALRRSGTVAGSRVAILGIGGLGHLAVQFAVRLGYETVAVARGGEKREL